MLWKWLIDPSRRLTVISLSILLFALFVIYDAVHWFLTHEVDRLVASPAFVRMMEQATNKGLKLEGHYGPLRRTGTWSVTTPEYTSVGRPGEAIACLDAFDIHATFDPWGILRRQWVVSRIDIARARIGLRAPVDALKIPFPVGKRPWYSFLLPTRFVPTITECPQTDLTFSFLGQDASATGMAVQVFPYGTKDWRIVGSGGHLSMRLLPPLHVRSVEFITARTFLDFQNFLFLSPEGQGTSRVEGRARLGMHEDKSLQFSVRIQDLPLSYTLPGELGQAISGLAQGWVTYHRPGPTRAHEDGSGQVLIQGLTVEKLPLQNALVRFTGDPGFERIEFASLSCAFSLRNGAFTIPTLRLTAPGLLDMSGRIQGSDDGRIHLDMNLADFPLSRWLPSEIKNRIRGQVKGRFLIEGTPKQLDRLHAWTFLTVADGSLDRLPLLRPLYQDHGIRALRTIRFDRAQFEMAYGADLWELKSFSVDAGRLIRSRGYASLAANGDFLIFAHIGTPDLRPLLPPAWQGTLSGAARFRIKIQGNTAAPQQSRANGTFNLNDLTLRQLRLQANLARFFQDPSWLNVRFDQLHGEVFWQNGTTQIKQLRALVPGRFGLTGDLSIGADQSLSGRIMLGCGSQIINWLGPVGERLFPETRDGLRWAPVKLSGSLSRPENDFVPRLRAAILSDPGLLLKVTAKAISWILGDWFAPGRFTPAPAP